MRFESGVDDPRRLLQVGVVGVPYVVGGHHVVHFGREHCLRWEHWSGGGLVLADDSCYVVFGVRLVGVQSVGVVQLIIGDLASMKYSLQGHRFVVHSWLDLLLHFWYLAVDPSLEDWKRGDVVTTPVRLSFRVHSRLDIFQEPLLMSNDRAGAADA